MYIYEYPLSLSARFVGVDTLLPKCTKVQPLACSVVDDDEKLNEIFEEIDTKPEVGSFTQDEPQQEDHEVEEEQI